jgi:hypothetical protein
VLGVVENMSGLEQRVGEVAFKDCSQAGQETDVTASVMALLAQHYPQVRRKDGCFVLLLRTTVSEGYQQWVVWRSRTVARLAK